MSMSPPHHVTFPPSDSEFINVILTYEASNRWNETCSRTKATHLCFWHEMSERLN